MVKKEMARAGLWVVAMAQGPGGASAEFWVSGPAGAL